MIDHLLVVVLHRLLVTFLGHDGGLLIEHKQQEERGEAYQREEGVDNCPAEDG